MTVMFITLLLIIPSTMAQAKTKNTAKSVAMTTQNVNLVLILNDGTQVPWSKGAIVPLSKLKGSYYVFSCPNPSLAYVYTGLANEGEYYVEQDPEQNYAADGVMTQSTNTAFISQYCAKANGSGYNIVPTGTTLPINEYVLMYLAEYPEIDTYTIVVGEVNNNFEHLRDWSFNFKIDKSK